jgi:hypothetical protein
MRFRSFYKLCAEHSKNGQREIIVDPFITELILWKIQGGWQCGEVEPSEITTIVVSGACISRW